MRALDAVSASSFEANERRIESSKDRKDWACTSLYLAEHEVFKL